MKKLIGVFSREACNKYGYYIYKDKDGKVVAVTAVFNSLQEIEESYNYKDKIIVGELTKYINELKPNRKQ